MTHLILCREYPPAPYPAGGIGTYARHIARLLAEAGETVHLIAQRWDGAPERISRSHNGRLVIHRISLDEPIEIAPGHPASRQIDASILKGLASSTCPSQLFSWQAARYAEHLIQTEPIDLIEAQEWEAPLYYLQVRRALGLGPHRQPPCLVHLHSPSQMIFDHNEWDKTLTDFLPLTRFEEYTIRAADALLCPSHYLAQQVTGLFHLAPGSVDVIPYPMGETPVLERAPEAWSRDAICYVGRLELRKGVVEWVDAAVQAAGAHPTVSFDFLGSDTSLGGGVGPSVLDRLKSRIPRPLLARFRFHGGRARTELLQHLAQVSIAVVPSRWENFPFTCIEAMATGLPVLVSPHGGMAELVVDGESGWVAPDGTSAGLKSALLRALDTSPAQREQMGRTASATVRSICANDVILARHLAVKSRIAHTGATNSRNIPSPAAAPLPNDSARGSMRDARGSMENARSGMGIVVTCLESPERIAGCLESLARQTTQPTTVLVVDEELRKQHRASIEQAAARPGGIPVLYTPALSGRSPDAILRLGSEALLAAAPGLRSIACIDQDVRLEPNFVAACESAFDLQPHLALVAPWIFEDEPHRNLDPGPSPISFADAKQAGTQAPQAGTKTPQAGTQASQAGTQATEAGPPPCSAVRMAAWETLAERTWSAVTFPGLLLSVLPPSPGSPRASAHAAARVRRYSGMALIQSGSAGFALQWFLAAPWREKAKWIGRVLSHPQRVTRWMLWQVRGTLARLGPGSKSSKSSNSSK